MANIEELRDERLKKLTKLTDAGLSAFPIDAGLTHDLDQIAKDFAKLEKGKTGVTVGGRIMAKRGQGGLFFIDLFDGTGKLQAVLKRDEIAEADFDLFEDTVDVGDFVSVTGKLFVTKRGENSVAVETWKMLAKSLRPLPEKWHGLQDTEERFRKRYLDTLMNEEVRNRFITRSKIVTEIRRFLDDNNFLEVETPILQTLAGGASAEPFATHHNALDIDLNLRIAPELYLKELLVGGFPKVYELGRLFRNEGIDATHNPEFTTVEFYESFASASDHRSLVERMLRQMVKNVTGSEKITFDEQEIDFSKPFEIITYFDLLKKYALISNPESITKEEAAIKAAHFGASIKPTEPLHKILDAIYKKACRPKLIQPTFIVDYPYAFSPLAKRREDDPSMIDRFQLVIGGFELTNAFSELNDPIDQRERFMEQEKNKEAGDAEAQAKDEEYLEAIEHGLPPCAGTGMSIDRLTMLLTNAKNIREVILFPTLRPKS